MEYQEIAEATDLFGNKIAKKMSKNLQQNKSETIKNEHDKKNISRRKTKYKINIIVYNILG